MKFRVLVLLLAILAVFALRSSGPVVDRSGIRLVGLGTELPPWCEQDRYARLCWMAEHGPPE
jgi:hypothetical protein